MARPRNKEIRDERDEILALVLESRSGVGYHALQEAYAARTGREITYARIRSRLRELEYKNLIQRTDGRKHNPLYRPPHAEHRLANGEMLLSPEALRVRDLIQLPKAARHPVGYQFEFLERYVPGETWYLPEELRTRLASQGTTAYANKPAGTYARDIIGRLIIDLSWGSSHLEGNQYSRIDTEELLRDGKSAEGASDSDRQMILNHKAAIEFLVENAQDIAFNRYTMLGLHALLSENLLANPDDEGRLRTRPVEIGASVYTPTEIPQIIEEQFDDILAKAQKIPDSLEQAFFIMVHLPYLQPFIDVNKRTSRLAANIPLIKSNLCPLSFVDVPEALYTAGTLAVYERTDITLLRDVFAWAYERSCRQFTVLRQAMGEPDPIRLKYRQPLRILVAEMVRDTMRPSDAVLLQWAAAHGVPDIDRDAFVRAARTALSGLRPEVLARYGLRLSEYERWKGGATISRAD